MRKIASFSVDHQRLLRGIYVSRKDAIGGETLTTFDVRMKEPNREPVIDVPALHTIEHLGATFLRSHGQWAEKTVYFGPMGCRTGCYVLFKGDLVSKDVIPVITELFAFIADYQGKIPGSSAMECGDYLSHNLPMARWEARKFVKEVLECLKQENLVYPG